MNSFVHDYFQVASASPPTLPILLMLPLLFLTLPLLLLTFYFEFNFSLLFFLFQFCSLSYFCFSFSSSSCCFFKGFSSRNLSTSQNSSSRDCLRRFSQLLGNRSWSCKIVCKRRGRGCDGAIPTLRSGGCGRASHTCTQRGEGCGGVSHTLRGGGCGRVSHTLRGGGCSAALASPPILPTSSYATVLALKSYHQEYVSTS